MDVVRHVTDAERRARLARRQLLAGDRAARAAGATADAADDVAAIAGALSGLHATDNSTVYLALWARRPGITVADVDAALYAQRTIVKQMAMRRTIFAVPRELLPAALAVARVRLSQPHRRLLVRDVEAAGIAGTRPGAGEAWLTRATEAALTALATTPAMSIPELGALPELAGRIAHGAGTSWAGSAAVASRIVTQMWMDGVLTRATNATSSWWQSKPLWSTTADWLGAPIDEIDADTAFTTLVRSWLTTFGPGTVDDIVWWLGATKAIVRAALAAVDAVPVSLDQPAHADGSDTGAGSARRRRPSPDATIGWLLPGDLDVVDEPDPWAALLPILDPTTMGWKHRAFYVGDQHAVLFDSVGNGAATAWWNGRIVGVWVQDAAGRVHVAPTAPIDPAATRALAAAAERLHSWLGGQRVATTYSAPAMLTARAALG